MYFDLNVPYKKDEVFLKSVISMLIQLGYDGAAFNHVVKGGNSGKIEPNPVISGLNKKYVEFEVLQSKAANELKGIETPKQKRLADEEEEEEADDCFGNKEAKSNEQLKKKQKITGGEFFSRTEKLKENEVQKNPNWFIRNLSTCNLSSRQKNFRQLSRLTILLQDSSQTYGLHSGNSCLSTYDILSVIPENEKVFQIACSSLEIDIITFDFSKRIPFYLKFPSVGLAIQRGIHFEITYSASIRDSSCRRYFFHNATNLFRVTKGKNILLSSEAQKVLDFRSPYDLANLGLLFGYSSLSESFKTISKNPKAVISHGLSRKVFKSVLSVQPIKNIHKDDLWKFSLSQNPLVGNISSGQDETFAEKKDVRPSKSIVSKNPQH
eukprot:Sdes_comp9622_c0_seq1m1102